MLSFAFVFFAVFSNRVQDVRALVAEVASFLSWDTAGIVVAYFL